ncbi:MAG: hypothetical protein Ct9H300mP12_16390 [Acidimicrobiales bacterium]|nr:MAG: hypothetical protein Ct9H300mP12_16390 [Acidimicrobiales bacterium]
MIGGETLHTVSELREIAERLRVVFLDCSTETLVRRYESSRRPHPSPSEVGLVEAIEAERTLMEPVRAAADLVLDTSDLNVHELGTGWPVSTASLTIDQCGPLSPRLATSMACRVMPTSSWIAGFYLIHTGSQSSSIDRVGRSGPGARPGP